MKKIVCLVLVITVLFSTFNIAFAKEVENLVSDGVQAMDERSFILDDIVVEDDESCITNTGNLVITESIEDDSGSINTYGTLSTMVSNTDYTFNSNLLTNFNTVVGPQIGNGANEPKYSYNSFIEENISKYSGELTLNFEDLVLEGRNGLDLRIGRTYQSVAAETGAKSLLILPNSNNYLVERLITNYSTYLLDRYNLGMGWGFNFPSVQIETEYIPQEVSDTYYYDEYKELYYHSGNGEVYPIKFTDDSNDSNLEGYYKKDIQFNKNDRGYSNGQVTSYYSMTLADKTKQYFAEDGRLIGIQDRYGNTIKFEHTMSDIVNRVPEGNFRYDDGMWSTSTSSTGSADALIVDDKGRNDTYSMRFRRDNENDDSFIMSQPIQVKPLTEYNFGISIFDSDSDNVTVEILGFDTAYSHRKTITMEISDYPENEWYDYTNTFSMPSSVRYIIIKICPEFAKYMYIDNVRLDEPKPLISKITDSIGRTVDFTYTGDLSAGETQGSVTLLVASPDGSQTKTLTYNKEAFEFITSYQNHREQRLIWYLNNSDTEGTNGNIVKYCYDGGSVDGEYEILYSNHTTKTHSENHGYLNKPVLGKVRYKNRQRVYKYEKVRKHMGDDGYYDTLRVCERYEQYSHYLVDSRKLEFKGEINKVVYDYGGTYDGNTFDNETGYPNYEFDDKSNLNEEWTSTATSSVANTTTFSNTAIIRTSLTDSENSVIKTDYYTNDSVFKNQPVEIQTVVTQNGEDKQLFKLYSYNDWGGLASESKEIPEEIKTNSGQLGKYTITYQYEPTYHQIVQQQYYLDETGEVITETNTYDDIGRLIKSMDAVNSETEYVYEDSVYPGNITGIYQDDTANMHNVLASNKNISYNYDDYGLYVREQTETTQDVTSTTQYYYEYIYGNPVVIVYPDNSTEEYLYYDDGRVYCRFSPYTQNANHRFYVMEQYFYDPLTYYDGYDEDVSVFENVTTERYRIAEGTDSKVLFAKEYNFYDTAGNLRVNAKVDYSRQYTNEEGTVVAPFTSTLNYFDDYDRHISQKDAEGNITSYTYDDFGRILTVTDKESNVHVYSYDDVGQTRTYYLNASNNIQTNNITEYYDDFGNVVRIKAYPDGINSQPLIENYEYNLSNNCTSFTDAKGLKTEYCYDNAGRLIKTVLPDGTYVTSTYSKLNDSNFIKSFDSSGNNLYTKATYYDERGNVKMNFYSYDKNFGYTNNYEYDAKDRLVSSIEEDYTNEYSYDESNNLLTRKSGDAEIQRRYNWNGIVSVLSTNDSTAENYYEYDLMGRLSKKTQDDYTTTYSYSVVGNVNSITTPSARVENYSYTPNGKVDTITTDGKTINYEYYPSGSVESITYPNGMVTEYQYDNLNRVTSMVTSKGDTTINTLAYTYDENSNVLSEIRNGVTNTFTYDELNRLLTATYGNDSVSYSYDALGNRQREVHSDGTIRDYVYDNRQQLVQIKTNGTVTDEFSYNEKGAVTSHNGNTYTYDEWDKLETFTDNGVTHTFKYDPDGIRTAKDGKQYIVDINNNVIAETDENGAISAETVWGHQPLARKTNGNWYYYIYNAHGDVLGLVDDAGNVVNNYTYDVWGNVIEETETVDNPIKYAGEYYDDELDMIYLRARYYNPQIGRFTSLDIEEGEISNPLDMNRYVYCRNNPIKYIDPSGQSVLVASAALLALGKAVQIVAGVASIVALSALTAYQINNLTKTASYSSAKSASYYMDWGKDDNGKGHVLKGSKGSEDSHGPIWKKFNIDPNNNNDWWKLLPILQQVVDKGSELKRVGVYEHGKVIGHNVYYVKQYVDKGVEVIVRLYVNLKGEVWFSDAWGNFLK